MKKVFAGICDIVGMMIAAVLIFLFGVLILTVFSAGLLCIVAIGIYDIGVILVTDKINKHSRLKKK